MDDIKVIDLETRDDLTLVTDSQEVREVHEYLQPLTEHLPYDSFYIKEVNGEYVEVYGMWGSIPWLHKNVYKIDLGPLPKRYDIPEHTWINVVPNIIGFYWFYGDPFTLSEPRTEYTELHLVQVAQASNTLVYIANGNFMVNRWGWWQPAKLPELPK